MNIEFRRLTEINKFEIIELMNDPLVRRQMPLTKDNFGESDCDEFIAAKERLWANHGYGPWAFVVDSQFAGWGGLQPENGEADLLRLGFRADKELELEGQRFIRYQLDKG